MAQVDESKVISSLHPEKAEEMEKEAKEYAQGNFYLEQGFLYGYERGFEKGRKEFENENAKQKVQIEKMKCCDNCKHLGIYYDEELGTVANCVYLIDCHDYSKWEGKEGMIKQVLLYLWQLPQNIVGLFVILFSRAEKLINGIYVTNCNFGVSLGNYIIIYKYHSNKDVRHEQGHQKQSLYLGWLYLFTIGILSAAGNLIDRVVHKGHRKGCWYYKQPWEAWADKLGGVERW